MKEFFAVILFIVMIIGFIFLVVAINSSYNYNQSTIVAIDLDEIHSIPDSTSLYYKNIKIGFVINSCFAEKIGCENNKITVYLKLYSGV